MNAEDIPLMIEAIPLNSECIVLVITKVEDPEELDTRFSKFAPSVHDTDNEDDDDESGNGLDSVLQSLSDGADDVLDLFKKIHDTKLPDTVSDTAAAPADHTKSNKAAAHSVKPAASLTRIYSFDSLNLVARLAHVLIQHYNGKNSLYKNDKESTYMLVVTQSNHTPEEFNKICNMLSEYGSPEKADASVLAFLEEHCTILISADAVCKLSAL